ncbi:MAG: 7-cyano-7-deazaguanine synthase [Candidatus Omnitrophica bacterium]|nr:7-cyano-7-deazaguanine synthase [Candidatus Omnitrophota bacterium]
MAVQRQAEVCVLVSGGLDSAVLVAELSRRARRVWPLYVQTGLPWEAQERRQLQRYLRAVRRRSIAPLTVVSCAAAKLYRRQLWAVTGRRVPGARSDDRAVYLPGRNLLLLTLGGIWCAERRMPHLAIGWLAGNPFADATGPFVRQMQAMLRRSLGWPVTIVTPYRHLTKPDVILRGASWPLTLTLSCLRPRQGSHCGCCNKCAERRRAFRVAGVPDPTVYAR